MDAEVEMHFSGRTVRLLVADAREPGDLRTTCARSRPRACASSAAASALKRHVREGEKMIAEYAGAAGAATFSQRALDPEWRTLVF